MQIKANLLRGPQNLRASRCRVEKVVEIPGLEFDQFLIDPQQEFPFIAEDCEIMHKWGGIEHCLLVLGEGRADGVLVQSEGQSRALFAAYIPEARTIISAKLDPVADYIARRGTKEIDDAWCASNSYELEEYLGLVIHPGNGLDAMLREKVASRVKIAEGESAGLTQERKAAAFDEAAASICDLYEGEELYTMLHGSFGLTLKEIRDCQYLTDDELSDICEVPPRVLDGDVRVGEILRMDGVHSRASIGHKDSIFEIPLDALRELMSTDPGPYSAVLSARVTDIRVDDSTPRLLLDDVGREEIDRLHDLLEAQKQSRQTAGPVM